MLRNSNSKTLAVLWQIITVMNIASAQTCQQMKIIVPAYFDPSDNPQAWTSLNNGASIIPNRLVAVANPSNGPGSSAQSSYQSAFAAFQSKQGQVIGYVFTSSGKRAVADVQADISTWYAFYPGINGIFFDEVAYTDGKQAYYQGLYNYTKSKNSNAIVVNNPGTSTLESYLFYNGARVADIICLYESGIGGLTFTTPSWTAKYSRYNFYGLFYNVTDMNYGDVIDHAYEQNIGWVYVTSDNLPNPWDTIASYFAGEVDYIKNDNQCP